MGESIFVAIILGESIFVAIILGESVGITLAFKNKETKRQRDNDIYGLQKGLIILFLWNRTSKNVLSWQQCVHI